VKVKETLMSINNLTGEHRAESLVRLAMIGALACAAAVVAAAALLIPNVQYLLIAVVVLGALIPFVVILKLKGFIAIFIALTVLDNLFPTVPLPIFGVATSTGVVSGLFAFTLLCGHLLSRLIRSNGLPGAGVSQPTIKWHASLTVFILFVLWAGVTIRWAPDRADALERALLWAMYVLFYFMLLNSVEQILSINSIMKILAFCGWVGLLLGFIDFLQSGGGGRVDGFMGNPNSFSTVLIAGLVGMMWHAGVTASDGPKRFGGLGIWTAVYIALTGIGVSLSGSRGALISLGIMILPMLVRKTSIITLAVVTFMMIGAYYNAPQVYDPISERLEAEDITGRRERLYEAAWALSIQNLWTGVGVGSSGPILAAEIYSIATEKSRSTHNPILRQFLEMGLLGMVLYITVFAWPLIEFTRALYRAWREKLNSLLPGMIMLLAAFIGYSAIWIKSGGGDYDRMIFVLLAIFVSVSGQAKTAIRRQSLLIGRRAN
jgi:O-antigen ligase